MWSEKVEMEGRERENMTERNMGKIKNKLRIGMTNELEDRFIKVLLFD